MCVPATLVMVQNGPNGPSHWDKVEVVHDIIYYFILINFRQMRVMF